MTRLLAAHVLRAVVLVCIALAAFVGLTAAVAVALVIFGALHDFDLTTAAAVWVAGIIGLLAVARIAHLALKGLVDTDGVGQG